MMLYFRAALGLIGGAAAYWLNLVLVAAEAASAFGIANERKWGYYAGLAAGALPLALLVYVYAASQVVPSLSIGLLLYLIFPIFIVAALLHPESREYRRIWFK